MHLLFDNDHIMASHSAHGAQQAMEPVPSSQAHSSNDDRRGKNGGASSDAG